MRRDFLESDSLVRQYRTVLNNKNEPGQRDSSPRMLPGIFTVRPNPLTSPITNLPGNARRGGGDPTRTHDASQANTAPLEIASSVVVRFTVLAKTAVPVEPLSWDAMEARKSFPDTPLMPPV